MACFILLRKYLLFCFLLTLQAYLEDTYTHTHKHTHIYSLLFLRVMMEMAKQDKPGSHHISGLKSDLFCDELSSVLGSGHSASRPHYSL